MKKLAKIIVNALITLSVISLILFLMWLYTVLGTGALFIIFSIVLYAFGAVLFVWLVVRMIEWLAKRNKE